MNNAAQFLVVETATRGLYQVVNTETGNRSRPWSLARCRRILRSLAQKMPYSHHSRPSDALTPARG